MHPADRDMVKATDVSFLESDAARWVEYRIVRPDGDVRHIEDHRTAYRDDNW